MRKKCSYEYEIYFSNWVFASISLKSAVDIQSFHAYALNSLFSCMTESPNETVHTVRMSRLFPMFRIPIHLSNLSDYSHRQFLH